MATLVAGIDPGITNLGISFVDPASKRAAMFIVDIHVWDGAKYKMRGQYEMNERILALVKSPELAKYFESTTCIGCERQDHPDCNLDVRFAASILEQTIRCVYPHIRFYLVRPQDVRAFWKTRGSSYTERKNNSLETSIFSLYDQTRYNDTFRKQQIQKDAIEAAQLAVYLDAYLKTTPANDLKTTMTPSAKRSLEVTGAAPLDRGVLSMTAQIFIPDPSVLKETARSATTTMRRRAPGAAKAKAAAPPRGVFAKKKRMTKAKVPTRTAKKKTGTKSRG